MMFFFIDLLTSRLLRRTPSVYSPTSQPFSPCNCRREHYFLESLPVFFFAFLELLTFASRQFAPKIVDLSVRLLHSRFVPFFLVSDRSVAGGGTRPQSEAPCIYIVLYAYPWMVHINRGVRTCLMHFRFLYSVYLWLSTGIPGSCSTRYSSSIISYR